MEYSPIPFRTAPRRRGERITDIWNTARRSNWSALQRAALLDLPTDEAALLRHHTLSDDIEHIRVRQGDTNSWASCSGSGVKARFTTAPARASTTAWPGTTCSPPSSSTEMPSISAERSDSGNKRPDCRARASGPHFAPWVGTHPAHRRIPVAIASIAALAYDSAPLPESTRFALLSVADSGFEVHDGSAGGQVSLRKVGVNAFRWAARTIDRLHLRGCPVIHLCTARILVQQFSHLATCAKFRVHLTLQRGR